MREKIRDAVFVFAGVVVLLVVFPVWMLVSVVLLPFRLAATACLKLLERFHYL